MSKQFVLKLIKLFLCHFYAHCLNLQVYKSILTFRLESMHVDSQGCPWNLYLVNIVDNVIFWARKMQVTFLKKSQLKMTSLENDKHGYIFQCWSDKAFKGTVVNQSWHSINEGTDLRSYMSRLKFTLYQSTLSLLQY